MMVWKLSKWDVRTFGSKSTLSDVESISIGVTSPLKHMSSKRERNTIASWQHDVERLFHEGIGGRNYCMLLGQCISLVPVMLVVVNKQPIVC